VDVADAAGGVRTRVRTPLPLVELRAEFALERWVLDALDRGASDVDLQPVNEAARRLAAAEDDIALGDETFSGMAGLGAASPHAAIPIGDDSSRVPRAARRRGRDPSVARRGRRRSVRGRARFRRLPG